MTKPVGQASRSAGGDSNQRRHQHRSKLIPLHGPIRFLCKYVLNFVLFSSPHLMIVSHIPYGVKCFQNSGMKISFFMHIISKLPSSLLFARVFLLVMNSVHRWRELYSSVRCTFPVAYVLTYCY